jgi:hypothetical protein
MVVKGLARETAIMAKAPEDVTTTAIISTACKVGSVLIFEDVLHARAGW